MSESQNSGAAVSLNRIFTNKSTRELAINFLTTAGLNNPFCGYFFHRKGSEGVFLKGQKSDLGNCTSLSDFDFETGTSGQQNRCMTVVSTEARPEADCNNL